VSGLVAITVVLLLGALVVAGLVLLARSRRHAGGAVPGYDVVSLLGAGAGTVVYRVRQLAPNRLVRLKRLRPGSPPQRAVIAARLDHPNVARVHASFEYAGSAYLTGEDVDGASLRRVVEQAGPLRPEQALEVVRGVLEGLAYAHARWLVHGALTPENVIIDHHGAPKLVDLAQREGSRPEDDVVAAAALLEALFVARPPAVVAAAIQEARAAGPGVTTPSAAEFLFALEQAAATHYGRNWRTRGSLASLVLVTTSAGDGRGPLGSPLDLEFWRRLWEPLEQWLQQTPGRGLAVAGIAAAAILVLVLLPPAVAHRENLSVQSPPHSGTTSRPATLSSPGAAPHGSLAPAPQPDPSQSPAGPGATPGGAPQPGAAAGSPASPGVTDSSSPPSRGTPGPTSPPPTATPAPPTPTPTSTPTPPPTPTPTPTPTATPTATPTPTPKPTDS
jgi:hypothetical protein